MDCFSFEWFDWQGALVIFVSLELFCLVGSFIESRKRR